MFVRISELHSKVKLATRIGLSVYVLISRKILEHFRTLKNRLAKFFESLYRCSVPSLPFFVNRSENPSLFKAESRYKRQAYRINYRMNVFSYKNGTVRAFLINSIKVRLLMLSSRKKFHVLTRYGSSFNEIFAFKR